MDTFFMLLSGVLLIVGAFFYLTGAIGLVRMPDVFTRMQASGISDTVGVGFLMAGMIVAAGPTLIAVKLAIILAVVVFISPVATHALAQAAMHAGIDPVLASNRVLGLGAGQKPLEAKPAHAPVKKRAIKKKAAKAAARPVKRASKAKAKTRTSAKGKRS
jgi:multicomponent Na+:H+ antiporter subunit G